jgi:hypothetical protein
MLGKSRKLRYAKTSRKVTKSGNALKPRKSR